MTTMELIERGIGHNCLSDAYELGRLDAMNDDGVPAQLLEMGYKKGRADAIDEIKENIIPTLYEFDVMQDTIDFCVKWLEQLKEKNK